MSEQEAFANGAKAMQGRIAAWLLTKGKMDIAPQVLAIPLPPFQRPETMDIGKTESQKGGDDK